MTAGKQLELNKMADAELNDPDSKDARKGNKSNVSPWAETEKSLGNATEILASREDLKSENNI